jgi:hypothetical protein
MPKKKDEYLYTHWSDKLPYDVLKNRIRNHIKEARFLNRMISCHIKNWQRHMDEVPSGFVSMRDSEMEEYFKEMN